MSIFTRLISGILGIAGIFVTAIGRYSGDDIASGFDSTLTLIFGAGFLYIAIFGAPRWATSVADQDDGRTMTRSKWRLFWGVMLTFLASATVFLVSEGVFIDADFAVLFILGLAFAVIGAAVYRFTRNSPEDFH